MASFTINSINYANTAIGTQTFRFEYKLWSAPDSAYTLIGTSTVNTAGTLTTPQVVTGLPSATLYYIRAANTCESPLEYFTQQIQTANTTTTFWNIYPNDTYYASQGAGPTLQVYVTFWDMVNVPIDIINYTSAYLQIWNRDTNMSEYGSLSVPYINTPNWSSFVGNPAAAIDQWLRTALTSLTGIDPNPANYEDVANEVNFTYSVGNPTPNPFDSDYDGFPSIIAAGAFTWGMLALSSNKNREVRIKFSKN